MRVKTYVLQNLDLPKKKDKIDKSRNTSKNRQIKHIKINTQKEKIEKK